jgi:Na+/proline symporter
MGVILGSAVCPIALAITWRKANKWGCIGGSIAGFVDGIVAWLVTTAKLNPVIDVVTSGGAYPGFTGALIELSSIGDYEMLAGNLASIGVGAIISTVTSYVVSSI